MIMISVFPLLLNMCCSFSIYFDSCDAHNLIYTSSAWVCAISNQYIKRENIYSLILSSFQVAALGAISNVVVDFSANKSVFTQCGGVTQLVLLSKSVESTIRTNAVWALKNLTFLGNNQCKEEILLELSTSTLTSLISGNYHSKLRNMNLYCVCYAI